jgi:WD40 repeat protein
VRLVRTNLLAPLAVLLAWVGGTAPAAALGPESGLDSRGWELVSPALSTGGLVGRPDDQGAGVFAGAAAGGTFVFGSSHSFAGGVGAPPVSQYLATRTAAGWSTANLAPPLLAGTYAGGAYQLFSADLGRSLLSNGWRCREGASACPAQNPPLTPGAPGGYRTLYLRQGGGYQSLLTVANSPALAIAAEDFDLSLEGASPDLHHVVIGTCAALTVDATEVAGPSGCDPAATNLYRWSAGALSAVNLLPAQAATAPGAALAAPAGAVSADGSRVYWAHDGDLYLRDGNATQLVAADATFQTASPDGRLALYLKAGHLFFYRADSGTADDIRPAGGVQGVLAAVLTDPAIVTPYVYYLTSSGLHLWHASAETEIADGADLANTPPATGTAHVSADGRRLAFVSSASLTGFGNAGKPEVFLYDAPSDQLRCVSCNPFGAVPLGPASLPGARAAAEGPLAYRPRALSSDGSRLFFDSVDRLVGADTDGASDVYEWEAQGAGSCTVPGGCLGLVSSGRSGADSFLDASADGDDAFFLTPASLVGADLGGLDVYDARAGGGFPEPPATIVCEGDGCQGIVLPPDDPATGSASTSNQGNPPLRFVGPAANKKKRPKHKGKRKKNKHRRSARAGGRS